MTIRTQKEAMLYRIRLNEILTPSIIDWFGGITILPEENGITLVTGWFADQSALRGLLEYFWNLNITVLSVERIENPKESETIEPVGDAKGQDDTNGDLVG